MDKLLSTIKMRSSLDRELDTDMLSQKIADVISQLRSPLSAEEANAGWTQETKEGYIPYFEEALVSVQQGTSVQYSALARSLDAYGISGGSLYREMMDVANQLNARS